MDPPIFYILQDRQVSNITIFFCGSLPSVLPHYYTRNFIFFSCIKGTYHEGDKAIYWLQLFLSLNLRTNTHELGGIQTRAPDLPVQYRTNQPTRGPLSTLYNGLINLNISSFISPFVFVNYHLHYSTCYYYVSPRIVTTLYWRIKTNDLRQTTSSLLPKSRNLKM